MFLPVIITKAIIFRWNLKHFWSMIMIKKRGLRKIPSVHESSHSVWTTITPWTFCRIKFVNIVGSTSFSEILTVFLHPAFWLLKQTFVKGGESFLINQPEYTVPHLNAGTRVVDIFVPAAPTKRYHPSWSLSSHWFPCILLLLFLEASLRFL